jgi:hypothetical protein
MAKRLVLNLVVAGIAAVIFWLVPLATGTQVLLFLGSIIVFLICFAVSGSLDDSMYLGCAVSLTAQRATHDW